jgi:phosphoribosylformimino-5-aminoimidazole carboxamide ribotide isomerase
MKAPDAILDADVLVIGSGAGGAATAATLAAGGRDVTVVEEGPWIDPDALEPFSLEEMAAKSGIEIEWGGGVSDDNSLASVFNAGATQAIIGSVAALRPAEFSRWLKIFGPERIILGADVRDGAVAVKGWMQQTGLTLDEQIGWFLEDGLKYIVCTDISRDGLLQGPSFDLYAKLMDEFQGVVFTASGGISCMDDIKELDRIGVPKVIVGKAIYEKRITLDDIRKWSLSE